MLKRYSFLLFASTLLVVACGENKEQSSATATNDSTAAANTEKSSNTNKAVLSNIKVTIKNGEMAGTYEAICREGCTSYGIAGEKVFGNQYSETGKGPKELSSVQLLVNDVSGDKKTNNFTLTVGFGDLMGSKATTYNINTNNKTTSDGSGTADIQYSNDKAVVRVSGRTKDGIDLEVQINSNKVLTMSNIAQ